MVIDIKASSSVLLTLDERETRRKHIVKIDSRSSKSVGNYLKKIADIYEDKFSYIFNYITSNNGSKFVTLNIIHDIIIYYSNPYSSFERGTNKKQNSLIRRFLSKCKRLVPYLII